ncbi:MAG: helix-turn-helix domain-containing protein [Hyphomicrobiaceae bacterium]|nr:helix-turn-helix domain-containing protein [Hyphomicrobiaceae bacterium]
MEKLVLYTLATYANKDGVCFPSVDTLVTRTGLSRSSAFRALNGLIEKGLVKKKRKGRRGVNVYTLCHMDTVSERHRVRETQPKVSEGDSDSVTGRPEQSNDQAKGNSPPSNSPSGEDYDEDQVAYFQLLLEDEPQLMTVAGSPEAALTWKLKENLDTATKSHGYRGSTRHRTIRASLAEAANRLSRSN